LGYTLCAPLDLQAFGEIKLSALLCVRFLLMCSIK
jgi:hypothetical protein